MRSAAKKKRALSSDWLTGTGNCAQSEKNADYCPNEMHIITDRETVTHLAVQRHVVHRPGAVVEVHIQLIQAEFLLDELTEVSLQQEATHFLLDHIGPRSVPRHVAGYGYPVCPVRRFLLWSPITSLLLNLFSSLTRSFTDSTRTRPTRRIKFQGFSAVRFFCSPACWGLTGLLLVCSLVLFFAFYWRNFPRFALSTVWKRGRQEGVCIYEYDVKTTPTKPNADFRVEIVFVETDKHTALDFICAIPSLLCTISNDTNMCNYWLLFDEVKHCSFLDCWIIRRA